MFTHFNKLEKAVHYPEDRRLVIRLKPYMLVILATLIIAPVIIAWAEYLFWGLPPDPSAAISDSSSSGPTGFPVWLNMSHWINFFFLALIIRSGLSILFDHPRLYWNNGSNPESEWMWFTPIEVPTKKMWTAKEDARYLNPVLGLPGYRHTIGIARVWHFVTIPFFVINGVILMILLFYSHQWERLVPSSWSIFPDAWNVFVHYATFNFPVEPNGYYHFNPLQQLAYFVVVFVLAPIAMITGFAQSPAIANRFTWYPKLFGSRQSARSIHFLVLLSFVLFIIIHVSLVIITGVTRNMNHITVGTDNSSSLTGVYIAAAVVLFTIAFGIFAHWLSWNKQRSLQNTQASINERLWRHSINRFHPKNKYEKKDISPYFWLNGKMPSSEEWIKLAADNFKDYKLKISGLVEHPIEISVEQLQKIAKEENITMHHCIQGWSGIAEWGGIPLSKIIELVKPHPSVTTAVFYSYGEGLYGGVYYDTQTIENCLLPESILAWEMNYKPLPLEYGAPLRLRVENQLGYKMVKWIKSIEFVETYKTIGKGYGGKNEDDEYFDLLPNT